MKVNQSNSLKYEKTIKILKNNLGAKNVPVGRNGLINHQNPKTF